MTHAMLLFVFTSTAAYVPTVALDTSGVSSATYQRLRFLELQKRLVLRLVEEGFAVVGPDARADIDVTIVEVGERLWLRARASAGADEVDVTHGGDALPAYHLTVLHRAVELARALAPAGPPAVEDTSPWEQKPRTESAPVVVERPPVPTPEERSLAQLRLGPAVGFRDTDAVDIALRLGGRLAVARRWALGLDVYGTRASSPAITVLEVAPFAGVFFRTPGRALALEAGLGFGPWIHHYDATTTGTRVDFCAALWATLLVRITNHLALAPGMSVIADARSREHIVDDVVAWDTPNLRVIADVSLSVSL